MNAPNSHRHIGVRVTNALPLIPNLEQRPCLPSDCLPLSFRSLLRGNLVPRVKLEFLGELVHAGRLSAAPASTAGGPVSFPFIDDPRRRYLTAIPRA